MGMGHLYLGHILTEAAGRCEWLATSLDQHPGWGLLSRLPPDLAATKPAVVGSPPTVGMREETQLSKWRRPQQTSEGMFSGHCVNRALTLTRSLLDLRRWRHWKPARGGRRPPMQPSRKNDHIFQTQSQEEMWELTVDPR